MGDFSAETVGNTCLIDFLSGEGDEVQGRHVRRKHDSVLMVESQPDMPRLRSLVRAARVRLYFGGKVWMNPLFEKPG